MHIRSVDAHTWAICDQRENGIWGSDTCHDVHMLQVKCHKKVDQVLLGSQAAERRASRSRACAKKRTYVEISSDEEDEEVEEVFECYACGDHGCDCPPRLVGA
jgi:hypothetical protein